MMREDWDGDYSDDAPFAEGLYGLLGFGLLLLAVSVVIALALGLGLFTFWCCA